MLFAHLKCILRLDRLRLRGPSGAKDEFLLAATAQNLRKLAKLIPLPTPVFATSGERAQLAPPSSSSQPLSPLSARGFFNAICALRPSRVAASDHCNPRFAMFRRCLDRCLLQADSCRCLDETSEGPEFSPFET